MSLEELSQEQIIITDISGALKDMPEPRGFIIPDKDKGIRPQFAKEITALFVLMHWPFINEGSDSDVNEDTGISPNGFSMYAALVQHGKKYVAQIFMVNEKTQVYQGTLKAYSIDFPNGVYSDGYDDWLMDELAKKVTGVTKDSCLGHNISL